MEVVEAHFHLTDAKLGQNRKTAPADKGGQTKHSAYWPLKV